MHTFLLARVLFLGFICASESSRSKQEYRDEPASEDNKTNEDNAYIVPVSRCRHNYHERTEAAINRQINLYLHAWMVYNSMAQYFGQCDIALPGFGKYFKQLAAEQVDKVDAMSKYQNLRGGRIMHSQITSPAASQWGSGLEAVSRALELEKSINQALVELYLVASTHDDVHASTYIQTVFIGAQVEKIFKLSQHIANLERVGPGLGEYVFDKMSQDP